MNDDDDSVRRRAVEALEKIGNPEAVAALIQALNDDDYWVRRRAVEALGKIGTPEAVTILIQAFNHEDEVPSVRCVGVRLKL